MPGEELARQVRRRGQRITPQRRAVIDVVASARERMTPAEVYRRARYRHPGVGLATVYRTLDLLTRLGLVERLHAPEGCQSYVADRAAGTHHHHVVCARCERVAEIPACDLGEQLRLVAEQTGFEIDAHWLELRGLCPSCRGRTGPEPRVPDLQARALALEPRALSPRVPNPASQFSGPRSNVQGPSAPVPAPEAPDARQEA